MKKNYLLLFLLALIGWSSGMRADTATKDIVASLDASNPTKTFYVVGTINGYYWNSTTSPTQTPSNYAKFAFEKVDGVDDAYYIYNITKGQWVDYGKLSSYSAKTNFITFSNTKGNYFYIKKAASKTRAVSCYEIRPYNTSALANIYLNWYKGVPGQSQENPVDGSVTMGVYGTAPSGDDGSCWSLVDAASITAVAQLQDTKVYKLKNKRNDGLLYAPESESSNYIVNTVGKNISPADDDTHLQFAFIKSTCYEGGYYMYSVNAGKFLTCTSTSTNTKWTLVQTPGLYIKIIDNKAKISSHPWFFQGVNPTNTSEKYFIHQGEADNNKNWSLITWLDAGNSDRLGDNGNGFTIEEAGDFSEELLNAAKAEINKVEGSKTYGLYSAGMPDGATVTIKGQTFTGLNAQAGNNLTYSGALLRENDITVSVGNGYGYTKSVDNQNMQVTVDFYSLFVPATVVDVNSIAEEEKAAATQYYLRDPGVNGNNNPSTPRFVKIDGDNIRNTLTKSESDKFIFIQSTENKDLYYIYDVTAGKYIYYTNSTSSADAQNTSTSVVKFAASLNEVTGNTAGATWKIVMENAQKTVDIIPATGSTQSWNYRGGASYALNLYNVGDNNSSWTIIDSNVGALTCATLVYAKTGAKFMHKIIPESPLTVSGANFDNITAHGGHFELKDRSGAGNNYKYVSGTAPTEEGEYTYTINLSDGTHATVKLVVDNFMQSPTPMMGWLTWNWFAKDISHEKMVNIAKGLKSKGLADVGFKYIVLDDGWGVNYTGDDKLQLRYDPAKFPDGILGMKNAMREQTGIDFKIGIYSDAGRLTCEKYQPGSYGVEEDHVKLFDEYGIDMLKYDRCNEQGTVFGAYSQMGAAIKKLNDKRRSIEGAVPFMYNACEWGHNDPWTWGAEAGASSWRSTDDVREAWVGMTNPDRPGVLIATDETRDKWMYAGVNRYNDLDMMCIGLHGLGGPSNATGINGHGNNGVLPNPLTDAQARSQMSLWCMFASPLSLTADVRETPSAEVNKTAGTLPNPLFTPEDLKTLTNTDIIAINQDALGQQAEWMKDLSHDDALATSNNGAYTVYLKDLVDGEMALAVVNRGSTAIAAGTISNITPASIYMDASQKIYYKNVWTGESSEFAAGANIAIPALAPYETCVLKLRSTEAYEAPTEPSYTPVTDLANLQNGKVYVINTKRGSVVAKEGEHQVYQTKSADGTTVTSGPSYEYDPANAYQQWAILKSSHNNYYMVNCGTGEFIVTSTDKFIATAAEPNATTLTIVRNDNSHANVQNYPWLLSIPASGNYFATTTWEGQSWKGFAVDRKKDDEGNMWQILEVGGKLIDCASYLAKAENFEAELLIARAQTMISNAADNILFGLSSTGVNEIQTAINNLNNDKANDAYYTALEDLLNRHPLNAPASYNLPADGRYFLKNKASGRYLTNYNSTDGHMVNVTTPSYYSVFDLKRTSEATDWDGSYYILNEGAAYIKDPKAENTAEGYRVAGHPYVKFNGSGKNNGTFTMAGTCTQDQTDKWKWTPNAAEESFKVWLVPTGEPGYCWISGDKNATRDNFTKVGGISWGDGTFKGAETSNNSSRDKGMDKYGWSSFSLVGFADSKEAAVEAGDSCLHEPTLFEHFGYDTKIGYAGGVLTMEDYPNVEALKALHDFYADKLNVVTTNGHALDKVEANLQAFASVNNYYINVLPAAYRMTLNEYRKFYLENLDRPTALGLMCDVDQTITAYNVADTKVPVCRSQEKAGQTGYLAKEDDRAQWGLTNAETRSGNRHGFLFRNVKTGNYLAYRQEHKQSDPITLTDNAEEAMVVNIYEVVPGIYLIQDQDAIVNDKAKNLTVTDGENPGGTIEQEGTSSNNNRWNIHYYNTPELTTLWKVKTIEKLEASANAVPDTYTKTDGNGQPKTVENPFWTEFYGHNAAEAGETKVDASQLPEGLEANVFVTTFSHELPCRIKENEKVVPYYVLNAGIQNGQLRINMVKAPEKTIDGKVRYYLKGGQGYVLVKPTTDGTDTHTWANECLEYVTSYQLDDESIKIEEKNKLKPTVSRTVRVEDTNWDHVYVLNYKKESDAIGTLFGTAVYGHGLGFYHMQKGGIIPSNKAYIDSKVFDDYVWDPKTGTWKGKTEMEEVRAEGFYQRSLANEEALASQCILMQIVDENGNVTGIIKPNANGTACLQMYDLSGRRVHSAQPGSVVIKDGKKYLQK